MVTPILCWTALFSPFVSALAILLFFMKTPRRAGAVSLAGILASFLASVNLFVLSLQKTAHLPMEISFNWLSIAGVRADFGFLVDPLSVLMLLIVTGVGSCIFLYSIGYMQGDASYPRYFASLSLFAFSMIGIVLANNFLMLFIFWELVAVSSYLLIGFWFEKPAAADAGNKAFIVNRIADFGLVIGILYVWMLSGLGSGERTFVFSKLAAWVPQAVAGGLLSPEMLAIASILVFCGVIGKSAQFPLYIWLPDAMEGPTPVSALIHAATMVAAGVYLLSRTFFLVSGVPEVLHFISYLGATTALLAAILAIVQNDIKKILAYSTISQLGYMVLALGLGSSQAAMFHLATHAFFKALLFLCAGAMIHSLHTQNIWEMGGLLKRMPVTAMTFLIGTLALCGIFPLSGFFSKDEILTLAYEKNQILYGSALLTASLTAFYMSRAVWIAVLGPERVHKGQSGHVHDAPSVMKWPLIVLAFFSVIGGFIGIPGFLANHEVHAEKFNWLVAMSSTIAALLGITLGTALYRLSSTAEDPLSRWLGAVYQFVVKKYYLDDLYLWLGKTLQSRFAKVLFWFDANIVMLHGVNGAAGLVSGLGGLLRRAQTGNIQHYAMAFGFGVAALVCVGMLWK